MYSIKDFIKYSDIILNDFLFLDFELSKSFIAYILSLNFEEAQEGKLLVVKKVNNEIRERILEEIKSLPIEEAVSKALNDFQFDVNKMTKGCSMPMHNETGQLSPFEILFWICPSSEFIGRNFVMRKGSEERLMKPRTGLFCFVNTLSQETYHGVDRLESDHEVYSIVGGLGRKSDYDQEC